MVGRPLLIVLASILPSLGCARASSGVPGNLRGLPASPGLEAAEDADLPVASQGVEPQGEGRIGSNDLLEVAVLEAPELDRSVRVSGSGAISIPLLGEIHAAGLTPRELELAIQDRLRASYVLDPHVSVLVTEVQSQGVSVVGAVNRPGVLQVQGSRTLLDVLSLAGGLSAQAGDEAIVMRAGRAAREGSSGSLGSPGSEEVINLGRLLESGDLRLNVPVHAGDIVKVKRAGVVYVVGDVRQPGAFPLQGGSGLTLLQAMALGKGLLPTAAMGRVLLIHTTDEGERSETSLDLGAVIAGSVQDPRLQPGDIVFVPNSTVKSITFGAINALVRMVTLRGIF